MTCVCASTAVSARRDECDCDVCLCFYRDSVCERNVTVTCVCASTAVSVRRM